MAELFDLVEQKARDTAQGMGFTVVRVLSVTLARVEPLGEPRYRIAREQVNFDNLHSEIIENCSLSPISRAVSFMARRQYGLSVELDLRLREAAQGMASLQEFLQIPGVAGSTATQQISVNLELALGEAIRGQYSDERTFKDDTSFQALPCTRNRILYRVRNRTLAGTLELDLRVLGVVVQELQLNAGGNLVRFPFGLPVEVTTTATGRFAGLTADEMKMLTQQVACREGLCGTLSDAQLGRKWGLEGAPAGGIPLEFRETAEQPSERPPEGSGQCYVRRDCSGDSYEATYVECVSDPGRCSWKGPDGTCRVIR